MGTAGRLGVALPLAAALLGLAVAALGKARAGLELDAAAREMGTWAASGAQPGTQTWKWTREALAGVVRREPRNPTAQELLGILGAVRTESAQEAAESREALQRALALRPVSPYTWAAYAEALYREGDTGAPFEAALARAAALGPMEPAVQRQVAFYGLAVYDEINATTLREVDRMLALAARRDPGELVTIARRRGRLDVACRHLASDPARSKDHWTRNCTQREPKP